MLTKEEILDAEYKKFIKEKGIESVWPPKFPGAYKEAALNAMEEYANQNKWISVKDRSPETFDYALVNLGDTVFKGRRYSNVWTVFFADGERTVTDNTNGRQVTHWQPLPEPPKQ